VKDALRGRVWRFGDDVDTDQIIPAEYLVTGDPKELSRHLFKKTSPGFASDVRPGDMIVGGKNFGCGSSREHAVRALMGAGISCVISKSFARIFYRNSINLCLPAIECDIGTKSGDIVEVDLVGGQIQNLSSGRRFSFQPFPPFVLSMIKKGGLMKYVEEPISCTK